MQKTKIVCTIGPASESLEMLQSLMEAGMNVARLNFSHGSHEEHGARIQNIRQAAKNTGKSIGILLDTKGPEIRTHNMENGSIEMVSGTNAVISMTEVTGTPERFSITYPGLIDDVEPGSSILLDDGLIGLSVTSVNHEKGEIAVRVLNSGTLKNKKGVNVPGVSVKLPGITEKDAADILFGVEQDVDFIAASFVRRASDVLDIRQLLEKHNATHIQIIPKIENQEGVDNIDSILEISEGLMVARGDLGVEIPAEEVPIVQKKLIKKCNMLGKPVITATQMLDSMQRNPRPTRAEASDVANAIFDGTDAIMLSGETAAGNYPLEAVQTMQNIAIRAEEELPMKKDIPARRRNNTGRLTVTDAIGQSVAKIAEALEVRAIIAPTESGHTARMISRYRAKASVIAVTESERISRRLSLAWGVFPVLSPNKVKSTDEMLEMAVARCLEEKLISRSDLVVITAGVPVGESGTTNLMKIHIVGDILVKAQGIGRHSAYGKVVTAKTATEALQKVEQGDILVTYGTDRDMMPAIEKCAAIITEEGGLTSHAAVVGISLGIPVIIDLKEALTKLEDGQEITVDAARGIIYNGHANVL
ncbi:MULTISPECIES: pyruvate kinase [Bacillaceae]|uniref:Pyruvate kinase n=1 Tax=Domibacillus aminovorans TaxID=29332 RepID=A0A177KT07_9BACI|nr:MULTISPECIES: pyruvate kinase [Bacillaceae]OAH56216.1 pyruvate kinase [Domibacillus aminovorans]